MEKYEFIFSVEPIFENDEESFKFENIEIKIYKKEEDGVQVINEIGAVIESENEFLAEKSVYLILEKLNNFFNFKKGCFLIKEPFECKTIKNLSTGKQIVANWKYRNLLLSEMQDECRKRILTFGINHD